MSDGTFTYQEITSQGRTWRLTLDAIKTPPAELVAFLRKPWEEVVFTGCGSTYYLSLAASVIWQSLTGIPARAAPASEIWLAPESVIAEKPVLLVAVSRSGETSETLHAIDAFKRRAQDQFLSITCYQSSQLALNSPYKLVTLGAEENSIAQTRSFSSMLLIAQTIAGIAANNQKFIDEVRVLPDKFDRLIGSYESLAKALAYNQNLSHFVFLGSGANYGLACEAMLKMKEMSLSVSEAFHFMEFRHGPKSMVTPGTLIVGLIHAAARQQEISVLEEMKDLGATVLALDDVGDGIKADHIVEFHSGLSALGRAPLHLPVLQLLAYYRSISKGLDPDQPKNLEAVVVL